MFKHLIEQMTDPASLKSVAPENIAALRDRYPSVPEEYFTFLRELGWGNIGGMMIYSSLVKPSSLYESITPPSSKVVLFGDDFQGAAYGFDLDDNGHLVEITPEGEVWKLEADFSSFIPTYAN